MEDLCSSAGFVSVTIACIDLDRSGTLTTAPTGTSDAVKYESSVATLLRVRGITVMMFIWYLYLFLEHCVGLTILSKKCNLVNR